MEDEQETVVEDVPETVVKQETSERGARKYFQ